MGLSENREPHPTQRENSGSLDLRPVNLRLDKWQVNEVILHESYTVVYDIPQGSKKSAGKNEARKRILEH